MRWLGRFLTLCILVPSFALFAGLGLRWCVSADGRSKVVTGAHSYPLAWTCFDPMHPCAAAHALCWLRSPLARAPRRVLQQKVKW